MRSKLEILKTTTNRKVYKAAYYDTLLKCPLCPPHGGCNRRWFGVTKSWKDQSRKRKQWM